VAQSNAMETDVLIIGGGAAGLTAAMLLAKQNADFLLVSRHPGTSHLPKAHVLFQKTMEIFGELGIADEVYAKGTPPQQMRYNAWCAGLAAPKGEAKGDWGRQIFRKECWGAGMTHTAWLDASPRPATNLPQITLEPIMKARADELAPGRIRFNHSFVSLQQDEGGVTAVIEERATGEQYTVRAKYLLGCDGGSVIGEAVGVTMEGPPKFITRISMHFSADLSQWTADDPEVVIRVIKNPGNGDEGVLLPMGPTWGSKCEEWSVSIGNPGDNEITDEMALARIRALLGLPDHLMTVRRFSRWAMEGLLAPKFRVGKVFLLGDSAHRHPPTGGLGLNTAVQDSYNICWKLAAVLRGHASDSLLDSYEAERLPVAKLVVDTAVQSAKKHLQINGLIGFLPELTSEERWANLHKLWDGGPENEAMRRQFFELTATMRTEYDSLNITFGYTYQAGALIADGELPPLSPDDVSIYRPTTTPGATVPASDLRRYGEITSIEQLTGHGRFALIAGEDGEEWKAAAEKVVAETGLPLDALTIGAKGADWIDWRFDWTKHGEILPRGAVLVRPDRFVAWRSKEGSGDPYTALKSVFETLLAQH
jgi:2,4-dichlorophenol 6-monooxygenase